MSSWYAAGGRYRQAHAVTHEGLRQYMGEDPDAYQSSMTLAGIAGRLTAPLLQVYGGRDPVSPPSEGERVASEVKRPQLLKVYPDGVHVCNNLWYEARPFVADWLADTLGTRPRATGGSQ